MGSEQWKRHQRQPPLATAQGQRSPVTGSWHENTSPTGYYKGAAFHGTLQMVIDPSGRRMTGMWLGFGRDFTINSGEWKLTLCEIAISKTAQRAYHDKA